MPTWGLTGSCAEVNGPGKGKLNLQQFLLGVPRVKRGARNFPKMGSTEGEGAIIKGLFQTKGDNFLREQEPGVCL